LKGKKQKKEEEMEEQQGMEQIQAPVPSHLAR